MLRRYRHLIADDFQDQPTKRPTGLGLEGSEHADRNKKFDSKNRPPQRVSVGPLSIATMTAFAILHLVTGVTLARSHASPAVEASTFAALDDEAKCPAEVKQPEPPLPYD